MIEVRSTTRAVYVVVTDPAAGRRDRHTVHRIALWGAKRTTVIGRELPIGRALRIVRQHMARDETSRTTITLVRRGQP